jgi:hypothetical protein
MDDIYTDSAVYKFGAYFFLEGGQVDAEFENDADLIDVVPREVIEAICKVTGKGMVGNIYLGDCRGEKG